MSLLLSDNSLSDSQREDNNAQTNWRLFLSVVFLLLLFTYLTTHIADWLHIPRPKDLATWLGLTDLFQSILNGLGITQKTLTSLNLPYEPIFEKDRTVTTELWIKYQKESLTNDVALLILFMTILGAFLSVYFIPVAKKRIVLVGWFFVGILGLYGIQAAAALLLTHWLVYSCLHPPAQQKTYRHATLVGILTYFTIFFGNKIPEFALVEFVLAFIPAFLLYAFVLQRLNRIPKYASILRTLVIQSAIITVFLLALIEGLSAQNSYSLPLGILLFFWYWERLMMYYADYKDGLVPQDLPATTYFSVFMHPAGLANWTWGVTIGQGYAYTESNFLVHNKNKLLVDGMKIWAAALFYMLFGDLIISALIYVFHSIGVPIYDGHIHSMVGAFGRGESVSTASVLMTSLVDVFRWMVLWAVAVHFKVGVWRICGYRIDPYFNKPWMATNLVTFWPRFTFHYREFLVRVFYYPVFFRFFRNNARLRIIFATVVAAGLANMVVDHMTEELFYKGLRFTHLTNFSSTWPYFMFLALGISWTEIYLMYFKVRRKTWTLDWKIAIDVLAVYCTFQYYGLIHVFIKLHRDATHVQHWELFLKGALPLTVIAIFLFLLMRLTNIATLRKP